MKKNILYHTFFKGICQYLLLIPEYFIVFHIKARKEQERNRNNAHRLCVQT